MIEKLGGTKFVMAIISLAIGTVVEIVKQGGVSPTFASLLAGIVATYGVANTMITNKALTTGVVDGSAPPTPEAAPVTVDLSPLEAKLNELAEQQVKQAELMANIGLTASNTNKLLAAALNQGQR